MVLPELAALSVVIMWSSTYILTKSLYREMTPLSLAGVRFLIIVIIAFAMLRLQARRSGQPQMLTFRRADLPLFMLTGLLGYTLYQLGYLFGLKYTSPFAGSLMISLSPLITLLIVRTLGERQPVAVWLGAFVSLIGVVIFLFSGDAESKMLGNLIAFGGGASFALYQVFNRRLIRDYHGATYAAWSTLFGSIPLMLLGIPASIAQDWGAISAGSWLAFGFMCIFPVYVAYMLWGWAISRHGIAIAGFSLLVPVLTGVLSWFFLDESFGPRKILGGGIAVAGLVLMQWANHRRGRPAPTDA